MTASVDPFRLIVDYVGDDHTLGSGRVVVVQVKAPNLDRPGILASGSYVVVRYSTDSWDTVKGEYSGSKGIHFTPPTPNMYRDRSVVIRPTAIESGWDEC